MARTDILDCFVIMPINCSETDHLWEAVYRPTIENCGCKPIRIDKEDDGGLLPMQIVNYLQSSPLVIADLTFARPNCYFEVGYVMGLNKLPQPILCCRADHCSDHPDFNSKIFKVHFDLQSYGILWWNNGDTDTFSRGLAEKVEKRKEAFWKTWVNKEEANTDLDAKLKQSAANQQLEARRWTKKS